MVKKMKTAVYKNVDKILNEDLTVFLNMMLMLVKELNSKNFFVSLRLFVLISDGILQVQNHLTYHSKLYNRRS